MFHLSVKNVSRSTGRSAVAAAAYRTGARLTNERDGLTHDYTRRAGVVGSFIVAPPGAEWAHDRAALWNRAEAAENRKNSVVAREYELALPAQLDAAGREQLARGFAERVVQRFGVVADVALHAPGREGDQRNWHAHILTTTRAANENGLGDKTRELDVKQTSAVLVEELRAEWAGQVNQALERARVEARVDHRSYARQGEDKAPGVHLGPAATAIERRAIGERMRSLPDNTTAMARHRAGRMQGDSRVGASALRRRADHLEAVTARYEARMAEAEVRDLEAAPARQAKAEAERAAQIKALADAATARAQEAAERERRANEARAAQEARERARLAEVAERERRAQAERDSWRTMPLDQLAKEVRRVEPPEAVWLAEKRPEIVVLRDTQARAEAQAKAAADALWSAKARLSSLEIEHQHIRQDRSLSAKLSLWLHDKGIYKQPVLKELERDIKAAQKHLDETKKAEVGGKERLSAVNAEIEKAKGRAVAEIKDQQRPEREKHREMAKILTERRAEQQRERSRSKGRDHGMER